MRIQVDVQSSIAKGRLKATNLDLEQWVNSFLYVGLAALFIGICVIFPTLLLIQGDKNFSAAAIIFLLLFYLIGFLTIYGLVTESKLIRVQGEDLDLNKKKMISLLKDFYQTELVHEGGNMLSYYRRATIWRFGLRVIVLFDGNDVLMNISRFNQLGIKSFFHPFFSRLRVRSLLEALINNY